MTYLGIDEGALFCQGVPDDKDLASMQERFWPMGVTVADLGDCTEASTVFQETEFPAIAKPDDVVHWRWVHATERRLIDKLVQRKKSNKDAKGPAAVLGVSPPRQRRRILRALDQRTAARPLRGVPVASPSGAELRPGDRREAVRPDVLPGTTSPSLGDAMLKGDHLLLQTAFYVEHRARLAILKTAIDLTVRRPKWLRKWLAGEVS